MAILCLKVGPSLSYPCLAGQRWMSGELVLRTSNGADVFSELELWQAPESANFWVLRILAVILAIIFTFGFSLGWCCHRWCVRRRKLKLRAWVRKRLIPLEGAEGRWETLARAAIRLLEVRGAAGLLLAQQSSVASLRQREGATPSKARKAFLARRARSPPVLRQRHDGPYPA